MKRFGFLIILTIVFLLVAIFGVGGFFTYNKYLKSESSPEGVSTGKKVSIPKKILDNKFGFLTGGFPGEQERVKSYGALWVRPHPGPFLWDSMQEGEGKKISFAETDNIVKDAQDEEVGLLVTLWPFADWDQKRRSNASDCEVPENDEFLPKGGFIGKESYLPKYRCNPFDWKAYKKWVKAVVERYDGDGANDMPGLKIPVKYWEVMNEPDLTYKEAPEPEEGEKTLTFYQQDPKDYKKLLIKTSESIRKADPEAMILIAGAAGASDQMLEFYQIVLLDKNTWNSFDIANIHCISSFYYQTFNVEPYKKMINGLGVDKPIWVTEAEAFISDDEDINATQTWMSTKRALELGANKIFFTRYDFKVEGEMEPPPGPKDGTQEIKPELKGANAREAYKKITSE